MIIAEQKRKENIAEYLLYMYQVEDLIRANGLDIDRIEQNLISRFEVAYEVKREMREWYRNLASMMIEEKKQQKGHLAILEHIADKMSELHHRILEQGHDTAYKQSFEKAKPQLEALRMRSGHGRDSDVQLALNGLYGLLLLKLKKAPVTEETRQAFDHITGLIAELSTRYMETNS